MFGATQTHLFTVRLDFILVDSPEGLLDAGPSKPIIAPSLRAQPGAPSQVIESIRKTLKLFEQWISEASQSTNWIRSNLVKFRAQILR